MDNAIPGEYWRPVVGWEDYYRVSNFGRIESLISKKILATPPDGNGYPCFWLARPTRRARVHRVMAEAFFGCIPDGFVVCHYDGNPANCVLTNLRLGTQADNMRDKERHGTMYQLNRTHCPYGHPYSADNLVARPSKRMRQCRTCARERGRRSSGYYERRGLTPPPLSEVPVGTDSVTHF